MKKNYLNKITRVLAIIGTTFMVSISVSCSIDDIKTDIEKFFISGIAVDGYIKGARVYLDCDKDFTYDSDEILVYTDANGKFSFVSNTDNAQKIKDCPVVVDATDTEYVFDSDDKAGGTWPSLKDTGREGFKISSPPGKYKVVSPLTMISHTISSSESDEIMDSLGITQNDLQKMGFSSLEDLLHLDYFSTNNMRPEQIEVLEKMAKKGRLLARILETKQSPTNSDANICIGQRCPELMKESLAYLDDIYNDMLFEHGKPKTTYADLHDKVNEKEKTGGGHNFQTEFHGDKIDVDEFVSSSIFAQSSGRPCKADNTPNRDFEFMISFTRSDPNDDTKRLMNTHFPSAIMIYDAYKKTTTDPLDCVNFFKNRHHDKATKAAKAAAFTRFIVSDAVNYMTNATLSTFYSGLYSNNTSGEVADIYLNNLYTPMDCSQPDIGCTPSIPIPVVNNDSMTRKIIKFNIDTMDVTVETESVDRTLTRKTLIGTKKFILLDEASEKVKSSLHAYIPSHN